MSSASESTLEAAIGRQLEAAGFQVFKPGSEELPALVAAHPTLGLAAFDIAAEADGAGVALNRRVARLRHRVPELSRVRTHRLVVACDASTSNGDVITPGDAASGAFLCQLPERQLHGAVIDALTTYFSPRMAIAVPRRLRMTDDEASVRAEARVLLDTEQSAIAQREVEDVLLITGPPGSGKTLVLAARAKWLAAQHPGWRISVLCFNRLLVPYLEALTWGHANISVSTFGRFASTLRIRVSLDDEDRAERDVDAALYQLTPSHDAVLIDEWQDFMGPWTRLVLASVRSGRGGVTLAGDPLQALYRNSVGDAALAERQVDSVALTRPYRSTRQILEVTSALEESMDVVGRAEALDGQPVDLVWAENRTALAAAVAEDVRLLLAHGERNPEDIGVLVTRKWDMGVVLGALKDAGIPAKSIYSNRPEEFDLADPCVKVMTVHAAKGYEFDVVFLVGLEHLAHPDGSERAEREGRAGYVGSTRAKDQLVLTYSKDNAYLDRIRALPDSLVRHWVWPDDYLEGN